MAVRIESFLTMERSLSARVSTAMRREALPHVRRAATAISRGNYAAAQGEIEKIEFKSIERQRTYTELVGMQAALFGASRVRNTKSTSLAKRQGLPAEVKASANKFVHELKEHAAQKLKRSLQDRIALLEVAEREGQVQKAARIEVLERAPAKEFVSYADRELSDPALIEASMHTSRMAVWGTLIEAEVTGIVNYEVVEQLDTASCEVCETMHGKVFSAERALGYVTTVLDASQNDPESVRSLASWPKQDRASLDAFSKMSPEQLIDKGWHIPPYHPLCRGIIEPTSQEVTVGPGTAISDDLLNGQLAIGDRLEYIYSKTELDLRLLEVNSLNDPPDVLVAALKDLEELRFRRNNGLLAPGELTRELKRITGSLGLDENGFSAGRLRSLDGYGAGSMFPAELLPARQDAVRAARMLEDLGFEAMHLKGNLTHAEHRALYTYTTETYTDINAVLRGKVAIESVSDDVARVVEAIRSGSSKWPVMEKDTVLYRGTRLPVVIDRDNLQSAIGMTVSDAGMSSAATSRDFAVDWVKGKGEREGKTVVLMEVRVAKGTQAAPLTGINPREFEVLLQPGTTYRVVSAKMTSTNVKDIVELAVEVVTGGG